MATTKNNTKPETDKALRMAGYCRTSGEGQRDNTSIPNQRAEIESFCKAMGWRIVAWYVDECKSGSKIAGRDAFQKMMKDAANGKFDAVVPFDTSRFGRDGVDILGSAKFLKTTFGIFTADAKRQFDNRQPRNTLGNFLHAGLAESERLTILDRTIHGRIRKAMAGEPWTGRTAWPIGRSWNKDTKQWSVNETGRQIADYLRRYLDGEKPTELCREYGFSPSQVSKWIHHGQLSGTYVARIRAAELGESGLDESIPVPSMPEVVPAETVERTKQRLAHNKTYNRTDARPRYLLSGFVRCEACRRALTGITNPSGSKHYRHIRSCGAVSKVPGASVEASALDYLYRTFLDEPAFTAAVKAAMPTDDERKTLEREQQSTAKRLKKLRGEIDRLVSAVAKGADPDLLISAQVELKAELKQADDRLADLDARLASMPDAESIQQAATATRLRLVMEHGDKDWRSLSPDDVRRFLHHLFADPDSGIYIALDKAGRIVLTFRGRVEFRHEVVDGRAASDAMRIEAETANRQIQRIREQGNKPVAAYQSAHHSHTFPCMSYSPKPFAFF